MKTSNLSIVLLTIAAPALAQAPADLQHHPGGIPAPAAQSTIPAQSQTYSQSGMPMPMGQMMHGGMMGGAGRGMMSRLSPEDMSAFADAHIAALHAGLKLSTDQEKLWPPVEVAMRDLARLHLSHMQAMRQTQGMMADNPVGQIRGMADHMSQGAEAMRKLADAAAPLYATFDEAQKRRLQVLVHMGRRGLMGSMMRGRSGIDDDGDTR
ncbi:hypothetical protein FHR70_002659 [Microvirga lupini]|uniref:LTXXQ motif family protein n=1 Tax=Microvirga lupini TaxID=420324 RepID=A0A7W4YXV1_9HYPH|nr:Spy/CpxP family protein refolding chaperone [Microvirga lupini]MBB3019594.1 hypothetical protein [Microvirga lupini]